MSTYEPAHRHVEDFNWGFTARLVTTAVVAAGAFFLLAVFNAAIREPSTAPGMTAVVAGSGAIAAVWWALWPWIDLGTPRVDEMVADALDGEVRS